MESIQSWAMSICGAAAICGLLGCLLPERLGGKTVLSLMFLCVLAAPLCDSQSLTIDLPEQDQEELSAELEEESRQLAYSIAEDHILELIRESLSDHSFPVEELCLELTEQKNGISIQVSMSLPSALKNREAELRTLLRNHYGAEILDIKWQEEQ